ncbi:hypothetical protein A3Q56_04688 [Intoshia linei]|uniref:Uncharacterized protein n=1 Tax=Intoshia linei TaxID=1819745 RepID=A0A177AZY8_9BILA|nr:hypothetical protein A3Q56_04688 [Intoshia linei]
MKLTQKFSELAIELLDLYSKKNNDKTHQLLTYELSSLGKQTCLSLAASASNRDFLAHFAIQMLLHKMWMGAIRSTSYVWLKIFICIFCPLLIPKIEYKTEKEIKLLPQTEDEHFYSNRNNSSINSTYLQHDVKMKKNEIAIPLMNEAGCIINKRMEIYYDNMDKVSNLQWTKKIYEFYTAPITLFLLHTITYVAFLISYSIVVLSPISQYTTTIEFIVLFYMSSYFIDTFIYIRSLSYPSWADKFKRYYNNAWNALEIFCLTLFFFAFVVRQFSPPYGRVMYAVNVACWYIKLLDYLSVDQVLGPYVKMLFKMIQDLITWAVILMLLMLSFGVVRYSVRHENTPLSWKTLQNVFMEPYFMIYGEVYANSISIGCKPGEKCHVADWVVPLTMAVYLIICNILLVSLLIAVLNGTFEKVNKMSTIIWKSSFYDRVIMYENKSLLPPPLTIIYIMLILCKCKFWKFQNVNKGRSLSNYELINLELYLKPHELKTLYTFEQERIEERLINLKNKDLTEHIMLNRMLEKMEEMSYRMSDIQNTNTSLCDTICRLENGLENSYSDTLKNRKLMQSHHYDQNIFSTLSRNISMKLQKSNISENSKIATTTISVNDVYPTNDKKSNILKKTHKRHYSN